ncbi:GNAT family N-acetyltransferase [Pseudanabaena sp. FACHB-1998]|uniref:GNAT family N-acetyltransferase n=1 Tax=Pseudanabaena sp. FACHB-1998 TaxID=2692858 RepID=UPI001680B7B3|nr:GNAT family N-acetyltransferase [Pseudanabaena sp. FACHB-1998]MBD2179073.1 GNAT family N-acetyltransferase [Pseudanabaena sp. FACHB-1998]
MDNRHIRFSDRPEEVDLKQLQALLKIGAFWAKERTLQGLAIAIENSKPVVTVWDSDRLIGHARATSDGIYRATIWDVVIDPDYRGTGLGRKLVQTVLAHPHVCNVERVYLMTTHQQKFYEHIGFEQNSSSTLVLCKGEFDGDRKITTSELAPSNII